MAMTMARLAAAMARAPQTAAGPIVVVMATALPVARFQPVPAEA
jgi:hypothetical protein